MILYNAWHLVSRFNNLYAVSTKDNVARLISQKKYKLLWPQDSNIYVYKGRCALLLLLIIAYEIFALIISDDITGFVKCNEYALYAVVIFLSFLYLYISCWRFSHG